MPKPIISVPTSIAPWANSTSRSKTIWPARERDPAFKETHFQREDILAADPKIRDALPGGPPTDEQFLNATKTDRSDADVDLSGVRRPEDLPQTKSIAETIYGPPPGPMETEEAAKSRLRKELEKRELSDPTLSDESGLDAPKKETKRLKRPPGIALIGNSPVPGGALPGKQNPAAADKGLAGGAGPARTGRAPQLAAPTKQKAVDGTQLVPGMHGDQPDDYAKYLPSARSLRPFDANSMRSTGLQEFTPSAEVPAGSQYGPQRIDPYGGLSSQRRPGQTPGQTGQSNGAYGASPATRGSAPVRRFPDPPGLRYDGSY